MLSLMMAMMAMPQTTDPLAPARAGKVQCISPNKEKRTCLAIVTYQVGPDGAYDATSRVLINPAPAIVMETRSKGRVENGQVCGIIHKEDYAAAALTMNGAPVDPAMAENIRTQIAASVAPMDGKKGCAADHADGDVLVSESTLDGVARPEFSQRFIWIDTNAGYTLGMP